MRAGLESQRNAGAKPAGHHILASGEDRWANPAGTAETRHTEAALFNLRSEKNSTEMIVLTPALPLNLTPP